MPPVPYLKYQRKSASVLEIDVGFGLPIEAAGSDRAIDHLQEALEARDAALREWDEWRGAEAMNAARCALTEAIKARFTAKEAEQLIEMLRDLP